MAKGDPRKITDAQAREIRINRAYKAVFGREGYRSEAQQLVWEDMQDRGYFLKPVNFPRPGSVLDPIEGQINEGKRRHFLGTLARMNAPDIHELPEPQNQTESTV